MTNTDAGLYAVIEIATDELKDLELNAQLLSVYLEQDPRSRLGYDKIKFLYTEKDGTRMHDVAQQMFTRIAEKRLHGK